MSGHATRRAVERLGLTPEEAHTWIRSVRNELRATYPGRRGASFRVGVMAPDGQDVTVVYSPSLAWVVTVLDREWSYLPAGQRESR